MESDEQKVLILEFIKKHSICVLATVTAEIKPEAAVITFAITDNFELVFETFTNYRKYQNLKSNSATAFVIGWDEKITVQYESITEELSGEDLKKYQEIYFQKNPKLRNWDNLPNMKWFRATPTWIRYLDNNTDPKTVHEFIF